jgi:hypothetical protein
MPLGLREAWIIGVAGVRVPEGFKTTVFADVQASLDINTSHHKRRNRDNRSAVIYPLFR